MKDLKILIAIPSKSRAKELFKDTFSFVRHSEFDYKIFIEPHEEFLYSEYFHMNDLKKLSDNDRGLMFAKKEIRDYCKKHGYTHVFKMDDDINNIRVRNITEIKKREKVDRKYRTKNFLDVAIKDCLKILDIASIKGVSFNYGQELRIEDENILFTHLNKRFQSSYIIDVDYLVPEYMEEGNFLFEDFNTFFNLVTSGSYNVRYEKLGLDHRPVGKNKGGIQDFDRYELFQNSYDIMKKKYPFLKWKETPNKKWPKEPDLRRTKEFQSIKI